LLKGELPYPQYRASFLADAGLSNDNISDIKNAGKMGFQVVHFCAVASVEQVYAGICQG